MSSSRLSIVCMSASAFVAAVALGACGDSPTPKPPAPPVKAPSAPSAPQPNTPASPSGAPAGETPTGLPPSHPPIPASGGSPAAPDASKWKVSSATDDAAKIEVGGLEMPKPTTWVWTQPTMQFRTLQYTVPAAGDSKETAELIVSLFAGGDGGPLEQNITRWASQFRGPDGKAVTPKLEEKEVDGMKITLVELKGAFMAMGSPAPKEGTLQLGAIIRAEGRNVFLRLNGPEKTVEGERANWDKLIAGLKHTK